MKRRPAPLLGALLLITAACGDDDVSVPCDIAKRACQRAVFRATAEMRGQPDAELPPIRVISRDQLEAELRAAFEQQSDTRDETALRRAEQGQRALSLLGLMPPPSEQSADDAYIEQSVATIAAYYSHGSKDITVIDDQTDDKENGTVTLSHEFVHALQDQRDGLSGLRQRYVETTDDDIALTSLVEGEATWLSYATFFHEADGRSPDQINYPLLFSDILDSTLHSIQKSTAPLIDATELLPYPVGGLRVAELDVEQGPQAVQALFGDPPLALRWWVPSAPDGLPIALDCDVPAAPEGYERFDEDRLGYGGFLAYRTALEDLGMVAYLNAQSWRADHIASYGALDDADQVAVAWRIALANEWDARALTTEAQASGVSATRQGAVVLLAAASDPALLETWRPGETCPALDKGRAPPPTHSVLARFREGLGLIR